MLEDRLAQSQFKWIAEEFDGLTTELVRLKPSEWAEKKRYLPSSLSNLPGYYDFGVAPYLREIVDCGDPMSPVRDVDVMKGVQIGYTVGVIENQMGYQIDHIKTSPCMMVTADAELAKLRMDSYVTPMLEHSDLNHLIRSADNTNNRKTGKTDKKLEWVGGGFMIPLGAQNANKLRSVSIQILWQDEVDAWPHTIVNQGDPQKLVEDRLAAYESGRKNMRGSTPLVLQNSRIYAGYISGDQRKYHVPCRYCGELQILRFQGRHESGAEYGMRWETENGILVPGSVRYACAFCGKEMINDDKAWMYRDDGDHCKWIATSKSDAPDHRSYHIPGMLSPVGMRTWETQVRMYMSAMDTETGKTKSIENLQVFYNNVLGEPFEERSEPLTIERVMMHRRPQYSAGDIPNKLAIEETGSRVLMLTATVDVHEKHLDVLVTGWCDKGRRYEIEWLKFEGRCAELDDESWDQLRALLIERVYEADDGARYKIQLTLVDAGYMASVVYDFCNEFDGGVFPIIGRPQRLDHFREYTTKIGTLGYEIAVDFYKDSLHQALRREWFSGGGKLQPVGHCNYPAEFPDAFFKELTREYKATVRDKRTGRVKFEWHRPGNAANHAWDLSVYNSAALEIAALDYCFHVCGLVNAEEKPLLDWGVFWDACKNDQLFYEI